MRDNAIPFSSGIGEGRASARLVSDNNDRFIGDLAWAGKSPFSPPMSHVIADKRQPQNCGSLVDFGELSGVILKIKPELDVEPEVKKFSSSLLHDSGREPHTARIIGPCRSNNADYSSSDRHMQGCYSDRIVEFAFGGKFIFL